MKQRMVLILMAAITLAFAAEAHASYKSELNRSTRDESLYDLYTGNARILLKATLFTDRFREAFARKHAEINYMNAQESEAWMAEQERVQGREWDVFVSIFTPKAYTKFSLDPDTFWTAYLTNNEGTSVYPLEVKKLDRTPYWQVMFPYISRWAKIYLVKFPKITFESSASFTMHSVVGSRTLTWHFKDEKTPDTIE